MSNWRKKIDAIEAELEAEGGPLFPFSYDEHVRRLEIAGRIMLALDCQGRKQSVHTHHDRCPPVIKRAAEDLTAFPLSLQRARPIDNWEVIGWLVQIHGKDAVIKMCVGGGDVEDD